MHKQTRMKVAIAVVVAVVGTLMGCSKNGWFRDRSRDYEKAEAISTIGYLLGSQKALVKSIRFRVNKKS